MVLLKYFCAILYMYIVTGCTQPEVKSLILEKYIKENQNINTLDEYSYILTKRQSNAFKKKILDNNNSIYALMLHDNILYMRVSIFHVNMFHKFKRIIQNYNAKRIILDLRNNHGGILDEAIKLSNAFLSKGLIVSVQSRENVKKYIADKKSTITDAKLVILVNKESASASEIVAGSLQLNHRAIIIGERTFGKGKIQEVVETQDGKLFKYTVEEYTLLNGEKVDKKGIDPHFIIKDTKLYPGRNIKISDRLYKYMKKSINTNQKGDLNLKLAVSFFHYIDR
jgi:C-terminal peptidase prc